ncbi:MAG: hypothetical protein Q8890_02550 [Sweet potato little leaf phytoplasma]|nr:hypothetical protein [Sweet potato little leaf phytoplasma]
MLEKHSSEPAVSKLVFDLAELTSGPVSEIRREPIIEVVKTIALILSLPQDFTTFMTMKNLAERWKYMILSNCKSRFYKIYTDWWNSLVDKEIYVTSQDSTINIRILGEVFYRDTSYIRMAIFQALNSIGKKRSILKQIIENNLVIDPHYSRHNLVIKSDYPFSNYYVKILLKML